MTSYRDVPPTDLVAALRVEMDQFEQVVAPEWAVDVKTGTHREMPPVQEDWWQTRAASMLRKIAIHGPIGTNHLAQMYGGVRNRGVRPNRAVTGSRNITRKILQQLDQSGLTTIKTNPAGTKKLGRVITPTAHSLLDRVAVKMSSSSEESAPEM
jgi:small subunit ribosomal protein S19e